MSDLRSVVWGNEARSITQGFGEKNPATAYMYPYAAELGYDAGTHVGIDVGMPTGTPIYAAAAGEVIEAGMSPYFRPMPIWIRTPDDPQTPVSEEEIHIYGHLWENAVKVGDIVQRGDYIGGSGEQTTGENFIPDGTGPHLHFERRNGTNTLALDPVPILDGTGKLGDITSGGGGSTSGGGVFDLGGIKAKVGSGLMRAGLGLAGIGVLVFGLVWALNIGADDIAGAIPAGRVAKLAGKVAG